MTRKLATALAATAIVAAGNVGYAAAKAAPLHPADTAFTYSHSAVPAAQGWSVRDREGGPGASWLWSKANASYCPARGEWDLKTTWDSAQGRQAQAEVESQYAVGYGHHEASVTLNPATFDQHAIVGAFTFDHNTEREIDIFEASRWGNANGPVTLKFTAWGPGYAEMHAGQHALENVNMTLKYVVSIDWQPGKVTWSLYNWNKSALINTYTVQDSRIPVPNSTTHLIANAWEFGLPSQQAQPRSFKASVSVR